MTAAWPHTAAQLQRLVSRAMAAGLCPLPCHNHSRWQLPHLATRCYGSVNAYRQQRLSCIGRRGTQHAHGRCLQCSCAAAGSVPGNQGKHRLVFLGTPEVAAEVLQRLLQAAAAPDVSFEVAAVVSQPGRPRGRGNRKVPQPSPVEALARDAGLGDGRLLCPASAREEAFLTQLAELRPDLCVTAAYGNILPQRFLDLPAHGTLNIHPSLLPAYRGAAPVQRALQDGVRETGVSVAFTVRAMDAGPILAQERVAVDDEIQAPELLSQLFARGTQLLLGQLGAVWQGGAYERAAPQEASRVTHAAKLTKEEGVLDFREPARTLHNKVRAFAGWPGTSHTFTVTGEDGSEQLLELKVLRTRVVPAESTGWAAGTAGQQVQVSGQSLGIKCGDGQVLEVLEVQPAGKKAMPAQAFVNGLKGRRLHWRHM